MLLVYNSLTCSGTNSVSGVVTSTEYQTSGFSPSHSRFSCAPFSVSVTSCTVSAVPKHNFSGNTTSFSVMLQTAMVTCVVSPPTNAASATTPNRRYSKRVGSITRSFPLHTPAFNRNSTMFSLLAGIFTDFANRTCCLISPPSLFNGTAFPRMLHVGFNPIAIFTP